MREILNGLQNALDMADFTDTQIFKISSGEGKQLSASDIILDEAVNVLGELEGLEPRGDLLRPPTGNVASLLVIGLRRTACLAPKL